MSVWAECLVAVAIVSAIPLATAVVLLLDPSFVRRAIPGIVRLAIGALLGAVAFDLVPEALSAGDSVAYVVGAVALGAGGFAVLDRLFHRAGTPRTIVWLNFVGDVLHNFIDGVLIAGSFLITPELGVVATIAVSLHELPRELGSLGIFIHGGMPVARAYGLNALTGLSAFAGAALTLAIGLRARSLATAIVPVAAGTFLYIAGALLHGLTAKRRARLTDVGWIGAGLVLTALAGAH